MKKNIDYRTKTTRRHNWDYRSRSAYFITINTKLKKQLLGGVENNEIVRSPIGELAEKFWLEIPNHFPNATLANHIIMPNHLHGIIIINKCFKGPTSMAIQGKVSGKGNIQTSERMSAISPKSGSISTIIRSFKSIVTREARKFAPHFSWQPGFHDRIIKTEAEHLHAIQYIDNNPHRWVTKYKRK